MLIQALGRVVVEEVQSAVAPLKEKMQALEKVLGDMPVPQNGIDGKDAVIPWDYLNEQLSAGGELLNQNMTKLITEKFDTAMADAQQWVRDYVQGAIDALPKAEKGERGEKGEKGDPGESGKDGANGRDGIDGSDGRSVSLDDVRALLADLVAKAVGDIPIHRDCVGGFIDRRGHLFLSFSDGGNSDLGEVVGRDGKDCDPELVRSQVVALVDMIEKPKDGKDGVDGVGFDDLELEYDGERLVTFKFVKGENAKVFNLVFPIPVFRGVWREGEYSQCDVAVRDGAMWIAKKDTKTIPGSADSDWQLCTKRGRDGKDGKQGPQGPEGKPGRNGRDLTQLGFDGSKY